ncbi:MAG: type IV secretion system DNA-binding domain-containing protein, partial [Parcubacteria group bacterium]|nr:type IV secretion system DNA-binding domain-containing protein [Parcubacteria group bacterium]
MTVEEFEIFKIISQIIAVVFVALLFLMAFFRYLKNRNMVPRSLSMVTLKITVPREVKPITEEAKKEEKEIISVAEQMYSNLYAIKKGGLASFLYGPDYISFEMASTKGMIYFYASVPRKYANYIEKIIHSQYPKVLIEDAGDYNMFQPGYHTKGAYVELASKNYLPIKTYQTLEADPMDAITNSLSKLSEEEGAAIQVIVRPASKKWMRKGRKVAKEMIQEGKTIAEATAPFFAKMFASKKTPDPIALLSGKPKEPQAQETPDRLSQMQEEIAKTLEEKSNKLGFETCIRIITSSKTEERADMNLESLKGAFMQYTIPTLNSFKIKKQSKRKMHKFISGFIFRYFKGGLLPSKKSILNTEELASIFHLPTKFTETPNIDWLLAKDAPPPSNLPKEGLLLGKTNYRGDERQVRISEDDRRRHMYIIGQTGTGKSVFLQNMIIQDIKEGKGCCVIDPHGDLVDGVLPHIPKERADDIILFEPFDLERPMGLNMLEFKDSGQKDFAVQEMINIFYKLFPPEMIGPMFEHQMRNVMLTLMADEEEQGTIVEIPRMFSDQEFADGWIKKLDDPVVRAFWEKEMAKTSDFHKSEMLGYLVSKVGKFVENEMMRNIMGQNKSAFDLRDIMDNEKVLLVNLSKGKTGEINSELLGLIIVSKIQMAAMG